MKIKIFLKKQGFFMNIELIPEGSAPNLRARVVSA